MNLWFFKWRIEIENEDEKLIVCGLQPEKENGMV